MWNNKHNGWPIPIGQQWQLLSLCFLAYSSLCFQSCPYFHPLASNLLRRCSFHLPFQNESLFLRLQVCFRPLALSSEPLAVFSLQHLILLLLWGLPCSWLFTCTQLPWPWTHPRGKGCRWVGVREAISSRFWAWRVFDNSSREFWCASFQPHWRKEREKRKWSFSGMSKSLQPDGL